MAHRYPHVPVRVPGVHGYASQKSVRPQETIDFHISADKPYRAEICRLQGDPDTRDGAVVVHRFAETPPEVQPIYPGSYIRIAVGLPAFTPLATFTFEIWLHPWMGEGRQCVAGQMDIPQHCGWGVFLEADGRLGAYFGAGATWQDEHYYQGPQLERRQWQHIVVRFDGVNVAFFVNGESTGETTVSLPAFRPGAAPLRLAACGVRGELAGMFLDADIAMPAMYSTALNAKAIAARKAAGARELPQGRHVLAAWPMREERGDRVADGSGWQRSGTIINHATWMVNGPGFDPAMVPDHIGDRPYHPLDDPRRAHALRFCSDDLYDCHWEPVYSFTVPPGAAQGLYVCRLHFVDDGQPCVYDITFLVARPRHGGTAPMLVLCANSSWLAYSASPFARNVSQDAVWPRRSTGLENAHPDAPDYCSYTLHRAGQPCFQTGLRMPAPNASPGALYDPPGSGFAQWARLERRLHAWLEREGYAFDLLSDIELHRDPSILDCYTTVVINGHSEYWSHRNVVALDDFLRRGGNAVVLSGNTMYLRVSFDEDMSIMEQRKVNAADISADKAALGPPAGVWGEQFHSQDWARGANLKNTGLSAAGIIGLETAGWAFESAQDFGVYHVTRPEHFLFHQPNELGLAQGDTFGHAARSALPRAIGHEWDLTTATKNRMTRHIPAGMRLPVCQEGIEIIAEGRRAHKGNLDAYLDSFGNTTDSLGGLSAEMIYWQRPQGGRVFHAGAVGASWVLGHDPTFEGLLHNILAHFGHAPA